MKKSEFLINVRRIADSRPVYREGGTGRDGTCDCIGLIMGALERTYPIHSSNYFARFQTRDLHAIAGGEDIRAGDILYRARADQGTLNGRYLRGGQYDTGDRTDYYHAGVAVQTDPLLIIHCTKTDDADGIVLDESAKGWHFAGRPAGVEEEMPQDGWEAVVRAGSGSSVNMRKHPSLSAERLARVKLDTVVLVLEEAGDWARIRTPDGMTGYMMKRYLILPDMEGRMAALEARMAALEAKQERRE